MQLKELTITQMTWAASGHAAQTETFSGITGQIVGATVTGAATNSITFTLAVTDADSISLLSVASIAKGGVYLHSESGLGTPSADFNPPYLVNEDITISIDPSGDGGANTAADVTLILKMD